MSHISNVAPLALASREASALGVTRTELRGPSWLAVSRGVHVPAGADGTAAIYRIAAAAAVVPPTAAIAGWAAAHLLGADEFDGCASSGAELPVPIVLPPPRRIRPRRGALLIRSALPRDEMHEVRGVPITSPVRTAFECIRAAPLPDAVAALDVLLRRGLVSTAELAVMAEARRGWRGIETVRAALPLADGRSRSLAESRARVFWCLDAGLPAPQVNATVTGRHGQLLRVVDLLDPDAGLVGEYDGVHHQREDQFAQDNAREEWLERAGLIVVRLTASDLTRNRARTIARLRAAHAQGMARDRSRDAWSWHA